MPPVINQNQQQTSHPADGDRDRIQAAKVSPPLPIYSTVEIRSLPDPVWQINGLILQRSLFTVYGPSGHGKTFLALDLALCVAAGLPFLRKPVVKGTVVYVYAEGAPNLKYRIQAWQEQHSFDVHEPENVRFIPTSVDLMDPKGEGLRDLLKTIETVLPDVDLVIIDTLAKCFGDADEDTTQAMNSFTNRCAFIRDTFDCTVGVVHHTGHNKSRERGNRALRSNFDTFIRCAKRKDSDTLVTLKCEKQKDGSPFEDIRLRLTEVPVADGTTCVVRLDGGEEEPIIVLSEDMEKQLRALQSFGDSGAAFEEWNKSVQKAGISESQFKRNRKRLVRYGYVTDPPEDEPHRGFKYELTPLGQRAIGVQEDVDPKVPNAIHPSASGPDRVQPQLAVTQSDKVRSNSGSEGSMDPSVGSGSGGGAYRAPPETEHPDGNGAVP